MQLRARGEAETDPAEAALLIVEGAFVSGVATYWRGDLETAREHLQAAVSHYRPDNRAAHLSAFAQDPQVLSQWPGWHTSNSSAATRSRRVACSTPG